MSTVAANVLAWETGALNIDGCRAKYTEDDETLRFSTPGNGLAGAHVYSGGWHGEYNGPAQPHLDSARHDARGRWPANVIHDGGDEVVGLFPETAPSYPVRGARSQKHNAIYGKFSGDAGGFYHADSGSAARFFYCAKASKADRDEGLEDVAPQKVSTLNGYTRPSEGRTADKDGGIKRNHHPTVKPTALMRYLCRLITPPGGVILDPFMGSGSTGKAAALEGFGFVGIEKEGEYMEIAERRIAYAQRQPALTEAAQ
jgi:site-specific DNA-methyltransferase (adenine-specific)